MTDESAHVVMCADEHYALPLAAAGTSLALLGGDPRRELTVVDCGLSEHTRSVLVALWARHGLRATFLAPAEPRWETMPGAVRPWITGATYARLLLPELLPADWVRVLYLDVDTLVLGDLGTLLTMPLAGRVLGAVRDFGIPFVASRNGIQNWPAYRGDPAAAYFNAGVLLLDLAAVREQRLFERAWDYCVQSRDVQLWADQEALNAVVGGEFLELDQHWNGIYYWARDELAAALDDVLATRVRIRHFAGSRKPWAHEPGQAPWGLGAWTAVLARMTPPELAHLSSTLPARRP